MTKKKQSREVLQIYTYDESGQTIFVFHKNSNRHSLFESVLKAFCTIILLNNIILLLLRALILSNVVLVGELRSSDCFRAMQMNFNGSRKLIVAANADVTT